MSGEWVISVLAAWTPRMKCVNYRCSWTLQEGHWENSSLEVKRSHVLLWKGTPFIMWINVWGAAEVQLPDAKVGYKRLNTQTFIYCYKALSFSLEFMNTGSLIHPIQLSFSSTVYSFYNIAEMTFKMTSAWLLIKQYQLCKQFLHVSKLNWVQRWHACRCSIV